MFSATLASLIGLILNIYIYILLLRTLLQYFGASYYNPISQALIKLTQPILVPAHKLLKGYKGFDVAAILLLIVLECIKGIIIILVEVHTFPNLIGILILAIASLLSKMANIFFYAVILYAILSWFVALQRSPLTELVNLLAIPLMRLARRVIPPIGGLDLSAIPLLIVIQLLNYFIFQQVMNLGLEIALR